MAELIDKGAITRSRELTKVIEVYKLTPYLNVEDLIKFVDNLPSVTEAEIRAKAIDEFAEKLHDLCGVEIGEYQYTDLLHESRIDEIAEQLKGGMRNE